MIKFLFIFLLMAGESYADQKVYYDPQTDKEVVDVSAVKSKEVIKKQFGLSDDVKEMFLSNGEGYRIKDKKIEKYDVAEENKKIKKEKDDANKTKIDAIKQKLNLSDQELKDLRTALEK